MRWWKVLGLASVVGVAATGVVVVRTERRRRSYTADEIRARLHARLAEATPEREPEARRNRERPDAGASCSTKTPGTIR